MRQPFAPPRARLAIVLLCLTFLGVACRRPSEIHRYTVRGEILQLPDTRSGEIILRHEAIDGFLDRDGNRVGMDPMAMPFPLAEEVGSTAIEGLAAGDVVEADFEVRWDAAPPLRIVALRKLPATTQLEYRAARP